VLRIVQLATRFGKLPSEVIYARENGWGQEACFAWDDAATAYVEQFERMRDATKEKSVPRVRRPKSTKRVPKHTEAELMQYLGINPEHKKARQVLQKAVPQAQWDAFLEDGDWSLDPEASDEAN